MNCLSCGHNNPATVSYCQKCGGKLDLTADEIQGALLEKAKGETAASTEYYARQAIVFAVVIFLIAITLLVLSGGAPEGTYYIPSASNGGKYVEFEYRHQPEMKAIEIPINPRKKQ